jgi:SNF2 family DNA or RNA helicase
MKDLLQSQQNSFKKLSKLKVGALFMEAGSGKTLAALELIRSANPHYILWLTPYQTKENLRLEINKWGGIECRIEGIESLSNSDALYLELRYELEKSKSSFLICDESLKIKNADAIRTHRVLELGKMSKFRLILNGTPISRNLLDIWSQMEFLSPKILKMNQAQFKNSFVEYITVTYNSPGRNKGFSKEFIKKYHNLPYLYSLIEPYVFESKLSVSVGQQHIDLKYQLTPDEVKRHNFLKEKYLDDKMLLMRNNNIFLELTQKMQHNYSCSPEKFEIVKSLIKNDDHSKFLIYAKYVDTQKKLKECFPTLRIMSLGKHSYGLNLQDFNKIIFFDKTWDYAQREQVEHRIFRTGQIEDCIYYDLTSNAGLDILINQNISKKSSLLEMFKKLSLDQLKGQL